MHADRAARRKETERVSASNVEMSKTALFQTNCHRLLTLLFAVAIPAIFRVATHFSRTPNSEKRNVNKSTKQMLQLGTRAM